MVAAFPAVKGLPENGKMPAGRRRITVARLMEIEPGQSSIGLAAQFRDSPQAEGSVVNQMPIFMTLLQCHRSVWTSSPSCRAILVFADVQLLVLASDHKHDALGNVGGSVSDAFEVMGNPQ